jgi:hypothetical protein
MEGWAGYLRIPFVNTYLYILLYYSGYPLLAWRLLTGFLVCVPFVSLGTNFP